MSYRLIAFDLDGTLLTSKKTISEKTLSAIDTAVRAGKIVILNTGRDPDEIPGVLRELPQVRYVNCVSGALVFDVKSKEVIFSDGIAPENALRLFEIADDIDCMVHLLGDHSVMQKDKTDELERFHMKQYEPLFKSTAILPEDLKAEYIKAPFPVYKFNLYCASTEEREKARGLIRREGLPVESIDAEETSLENTPVGIHKGIGMMKLCKHLGIDIKETIAVGDSGNDLPALKAAGLAIAMTNASPEIRTAADVIVADNDHDGCAEAIYEYLMK